MQVVSNSQRDFGIINAALTKFLSFSQFIKKWKIDFLENKPRAVLSNFSGFIKELGNYYAFKAIPLS